MIKEDSNENTDEKFDHRSFLANLAAPGGNIPPLTALEAFKHSRDLLAGLGAAGRIPNPMSALGFPPSGPPHTTYSHLPTTPARPPSQPTTPSSQQSSSPIQQNFSSQQNWSFEEQFKQVSAREKLTYFPTLSVLFLALKSIILVHITYLVHY